MRYQRNTTIYLLALPAVVWFAVFVYYPSILGFIVSFQKYSLIGKSTWVGWENYRQVFSSMALWNTVGNTLVIGFIILVLNVIIPVCVALLLNELSSPGWKKFIQTSLYITHLFGWVVIAGIWIYVLAEDIGFVNIILKNTGHSQIPFLSSERYGKALVILLMIWRELGYLCILYLASISSINPELYESAVLDGAGRGKQILYITLPALVPTIKILVILGITEMFKLFDPVWVLRNPGNLLAIDTIMIHLKQYGIDRFQFGYTSAISSLLFLVIVTVTLVTKRCIKYRM